MFVTHHEFKRENALKILLFSRLSPSQLPVAFSSGIDLGLSDLDIENDLANDLYDEDVYDEDRGFDVEYEVSQINTRVTHYCVIKDCNSLKTSLCM